MNFYYATFMFSHSFILDREFMFGHPTVVWQFMRPSRKNVWRPMMQSNGQSCLEVLAMCHTQRWIFIFGALGHWESLLKVYNDWCHRNQHCTCSLHSLTKFVLIHKQITLFRIISISGARAASATLHTPQLGATLSQGMQNSELKSPKQNFNLPNVNMKH